VNRGRVLLLLVTLLGVQVQRARADDAATLRWDGPDCRESAIEFTEALNTLLTAAEQARLRGTIRTTSSRAGGYDLILVLNAGGVDGERTLRAKSCSHAARTSALIVAMAAYPERDFGARNVDAGDGDAAPLEPDAGAPVLDGSAQDAWREAAKTDVSPVVAAPDVPVDIEAALLGSAQTGALPGAVVGVGVELGIRVNHRFALFAGLNWSPSQRRTLQPYGEITLSILPSYVHLCYAPIHGERFTLDACLGTSLWWMRGQGAGFDQDGSGTIFVAAPSATVSGQIALWRGAKSQFAWKLEVSVAVPLTQQRFLVAQQPLYDSAAASLMLRSGPTFIF
jgi:hypothetical protein